MTDTAHRARMTAMNQTANKATAANHWTPTPGASLADVLAEQAVGDPGSVYTDSARYLLGQTNTERTPTMDRHDFNGSKCPHPRCREADGWQCAECGHYFPRSQVREDRASGDVYCRDGKGHNGTRRA